MHMINKNNLHIPRVERSTLSTTNYLYFKKETVKLNTELKLNQLHIYSEENNSKVNLHLQVPFSYKC